MTPSGPFLRFAPGQTDDMTGQARLVGSVSVRGRSVPVRFLSIFSKTSPSTRENGHVDHA
ncbi:hypothetical protein SACS_0440 [Parasaccharibacter apium]|uniref:Uncharacterized protein n=1 Tax=Parasaccharibacter apium TaxID=1510841 RepID=A0A7U7G4U6_9PROT|nr:hypothetical protein SACS_0440 [Parasaccharibacter apium]